MKIRLCTLLLITYLLPIVSFGQTPSTVDAEIKRVEQGLLPAVLIKGEPGWTIEERLKFFRAHGLSVAVIKDFKVHWARAYGVKDLETKEPVTTETLFQAGSISKSVNAMIAMKKVEQGKISLDANINDKLVSWKLPDNEFTAKKKVSLKTCSVIPLALPCTDFPATQSPRKFRRCNRSWMAPHRRTPRRSASTSSQARAFAIRAAARRLHR